MLYYKSNCRKVIKYEKVEEAAPAEAVEAQSTTVPAVPVAAS
jgi:hypothetical protein